MNDSEERRIVVVLPLDGGGLVQRGRLLAFQHQILIII